MFRDTVCHLAEPLSAIPIVATIVVLFITISILAWKDGRIRSCISGISLAMFASSTFVSLGLLAGRIQSLDWTGGVDRWTGLDWTGMDWTGLDRNGMHCKISLERALVLV